MNWLGELVQKNVNLDDTVLDLGCGIRHTIDGLQCKSYLGCDIWMKYLEQVKEKHMIIHLDITKELERFPDKSYDVVLCLDVLEHVELEQAEYILSNMKRICRKKAIIFTPSEFKSNETAAEDAWGLGECKFQYHKCLIPIDLLQSKGFTVRQKNEDNAFYGVYNGN